MRSGTYVLCGLGPQERHAVCVTDRGGHGVGGCVPRSTRERLERLYPARASGADVRASSLIGTIWPVSVSVRCSTSGRLPSSRCALRSARARLRRWRRAGSPWAPEPTDLAVYFAVRLPNNTARSAHPHARGGRDGKHSPSIPVGPRCRRRAATRLLANRPSGAGSGEGIKAGTVGGVTLNLPAGARNWSATWPRPTPTGCTNSSSSRREAAHRCAVPRRAHSCAASLPSDR